MKKYTAAVCLCVLSFSFNLCWADSFDDFKKEQMSDYQSYVSSIDKEFTNFLKQQWTEYNGEQPVKPYEAPKPVQMPVAPPKPDLTPVKIVPQKKPEPPVSEQPEAKPVDKQQPVASTTPQTPPEPKPPYVPAPTPPAPPTPQPPYVPYQQQGTTVALSYFGISLSIPYDKKIMAEADKPLSSDSIAKWWETVAGADFKKSLDYMQNAAKQYQLGDWGYIMLLDRFTARLEGSAPEQKMLVWFFLNKSGYNAKLGYTASGKSKLMMTSDVALYGVPYFTLNGTKYYVINTLGQKEATEDLYTYDGSYPDAVKPVTFLRMQMPRLSFVRYDRQLKFDYSGQQYSFDAVANKYDIQYYNSFPQADLEVYTSAQVPSWIDQTVVPALSDAVKGKSVKDSVNLILRFVQTAFNYKTDEDQFGHEKFFFAEETIYYPYSDCEDRSVLFAYLVETILKRNVIMLNFPNHVATAVDMGSDSDGAYLTFKGKRYTVADPTYINAVAGMVMPEFKGVSPEIEETGVIM